MAQQVGSLYTSLTLESSSFLSNMKRAATAAESGAAQIDKAFNAASVAAKGFVAAFTVDKVVQLAAAGLDYAASIGETAQQLGVSTKALQEYRFAATQAGVSQDQLETGLSRLTKTLGEAKAGGKAQVEAFAAIGVTYAELERLTPDEAFRRAADGLGKIADPAKRAAIEVDLFGKAGQKLDTLLAGGTAALDGLAASAAKLGVVLSDDAIAKADETADKLAAVQTVLSANIASTVADNADSILYLANAVIKLSAAAGSGIRDIRDFFRGTAEIRKEQGFFAAAGAQIFGTDEALIARGRQARERDGFLSRVLGTPLNAATAGGPPAAVSAGLVTGGARRGGGRGGRSGGGAAARDPRAGINELLGVPAALSDGFATIGEDAAKTLAQLDGSAKSLGDTLNSAFSTSGLDGLIQKVPDLGAGFDALAVSGQKFGEDLSRNLGQAIVYGQSLGDALINSIQAAAAELITSGLLDLLKGGSGGGGGFFGSLLSSVGSFFGGARANGGPVQSNKAYLVGERGPEILTGAAGRIIPNELLKSGMGGGRQAVAVSVDVQPSPLFITATRVAAQQGGQQAVGDALRRQGRTALAGGRG